LPTGLLNFEIVGGIQYSKDGTTYVRPFHATVRPFGPDGGAEFTGPPISVRSGSATTSLPILTSSAISTMASLRHTTRSAMTCRHLSCSTF
jgi:hypothetical protein